jgi:hypothetical protein
MANEQTLRDALTKAQDFIRDSVEFGYVKDGGAAPGWRETLRDIRAALSLPEAVQPPAAAAVEAIPEDDNRKGGVA